MKEKQVSNVRLLVLIGILVAVVVIGVVVTKLISHFYDPGGYIWNTRVEEDYEDDEDGYIKNPYENYQSPQPQDYGTPINWQKDTFVPDKIPQKDHTVDTAANAHIVPRGTRIPIADQGLIVGQASNESDKSVYTGGIEYFDFGTRGSNKIILVTTPLDGMGVGIQAFFFEQTGSDYIFMSAMSPWGLVFTKENDYGYVLSSKVDGIDTNTFYGGINGPRELTYNGMKLVRMNAPDSPGAFFVVDDPVDPQRHATQMTVLPEGVLYVAGGKRDQFQISYTYLKLPTGLSAQYIPKYEFMSDDRVPGITWNNGRRNYDVYNTDGILGGCGHYGAYVKVAYDISAQIRSTGVTDTGETIYEFADPNDPLLKYFYLLSNGGRTEAQVGYVTYENWLTYHPVILYKNAYGDHAIFTNQNFGLAAECGKPVIYLYPEKITDVSVRVGADVTVSEPLYENGWLVKAEPSGTLTMKNGVSKDETFGSLFWEGTGFGEYPEITYGTIVPRADAEKTIVAHLKAMNLNETEIADFTEFWFSRLPDAPYVRLTWFTNTELDRLAPLTVFPKPETSIRVFLDFQGLASADAMPDLKPQKFVSTPRNGFTLVEWGGLLVK